MRGTMVEKEVDIRAANLADKTKRMSTNAKKWKTICEDMSYLSLAPSMWQKLNTRDRNLMETLKESVTPYISSL
jgi:hypothetical protein